MIPVKFTLQYVFSLFKKIHVSFRKIQFIKRDMEKKKKRKKTHATFFERYNFTKLFDGHSSRSGRGTLSIALCVKRPRSLHVAIYVRAKRVVAHNRYLFPTCLIASNYFTGACQRRWSIHMGAMLRVARFSINLSIELNIVYP